jgi:hypothetical protein
MVGGVGGGIGAVVVGARDVKFVVCSIFGPGLGRGLVLTFWAAWWGVARWDGVVLCSNVESSRRTSEASDECGMGLASW